MTAVDDDFSRKIQTSYAILYRIRGGNTAIPNYRATLRALQQKPLVELLIDFLNGRVRYVGVRSRVVLIDPLTSA